MPGSNIMSEIPQQPIVLNSERYGMLIESNYTESFDNIFRHSLGPHPASTTRYVSSLEYYMISTKKIKKIKKDISYITNSYGLRSDEFKSTHNERHILFAGCSFTFGEGLPYMQNWSGKLFNMISEGVSLSGFFNLGYSGGSVDYICNSIYKYVELFGSPSNLFVLFPDFGRKISNYQGKDIIIMPNRSVEMQMIAAWGQGKDPFEYQYGQIMDLYRFCHDSGIDMTWGTWMPDDRAKIPINAPGYVDIDPDQIEKYSDKPTKEWGHYYLSARDNSHPGIMYNSAVANIFKESYDFTKN